MTTKTKTSSARMAVTMMIAVVLGISYQSLAKLPESQVRASYLADTSTNVDTIREDVIQFVQNTMNGLASHTTSVGSHASAPEVSNIIPDMTNSITKVPKHTYEPCEGDVAQDIANHTYADDVRWGLEYCLVSTQPNNRVYPDNHLTHQAMLTIADRLGYNVDLSLGSSDVVSKSEMMKFIDYLQSSDQISMIPAISWSTIVTRAEYLRFMRMITPVMPTVVETSEKSQQTKNTTPNTGTLSMRTGNQSEDISSMTVKKFKELMNTKHNAKFIINSYDNNVMITPEIISSLLTDTTTTIDTDSNKIDLTQVGIDKETIKESLNRLIEKI